MLHNAIGENFMRQEHARMWQVAQTPKKLSTLFKTYPYGIKTFAKSQPYNHACPCRTYRHSCRYCASPVARRYSRGFRAAIHTWIRAKYSPERDRSAERPARNHNRHTRRIPSEKIPETPMNDPVIVGLVLIVFLLFAFTFKKESNIWVKCSAIRST